jgi:type VI secretion system protein ImpC
LLCALVIADGVAAGDSPATHGTIERLPLYVAPVDGVPTATPCAETLLTQRAVEAMLDAGVSALVSPRDADTIVIPRIQSVASPLRALSVPASIG